jgi:hypothetical protein
VIPPGIHDIAKQQQLRQRIPPADDLAHRCATTEVYDAIRDSMRWPAWWRGAEKVTQSAFGERNGLNSIRRYAWRGKLP